MTQLLVKDAPFNFSKECIQAFDKLKHELTQAPIMIKPDWSLPFEVMCNTSDYAIGAIRDKKGAENLAPDHLSRLENPDLGKLTKAEIRDLFPEEQLMEISDKNNEPCRPSGGHHGNATTEIKVFKAGFYWPHIFRDARTSLQFTLKTVPRETKVEMVRTIFDVQGHKDSAIELYNEDENEFIVNKQRVKPYQESVLDTNRDDDITLNEEGEDTKAHLLEDKQIPSVGVFDEVFLALGWHLEEIHPEDEVISIKRRRQDIHGDDVKDSVTTSGCGQLKVNLEASTWRRRQEYKAMPSQRYLYIYKTDFK
ncbi:reverse transcriptase domain-containing protein, partial [Tanacetum coccineum]